MTDTGTSAPQATYPEIVPAPRSDPRPFNPDTRPSAAPDQTYPKITPAPKQIENVCPTCGKTR